MSLSALPSPIPNHQTLSCLICISALSFACISTATLHLSPLPQAHSIPSLPGLSLLSLPFSLLYQLLRLFYFAHLLSGLNSLGWRFLYLFRLRLFKDNFSYLTFTICTICAICCICAIFKYHFTHKFLIP